MFFWAGLLFLIVIVFIHKHVCIRTGGMINEGNRYCKHKLQSKVEYLDNGIKRITMSCKHCSRLYVVTQNYDVEEYKKSQEKKD